MEKPLLSLYWSPKNQVSLSPMVFTIYTQTTHSAAHKERLPPGSAYLVEELFAGGAGQDGELQLRVHGCYANIDLPEKKTNADIQEDTLSCVKERRSIKATAIFEFFVGGQLGSPTAKMTKKRIPYMSLFNQEHPITRGWWGLQSKHGAHITL